MNKKLLVLAAVMAFTPAVSFAEEYENDLQIHGRSPESLIATLAQKGIAAENVEEWGNLIRVDTRDAETGAHSFVLLDKDTLQPRQATSANTTGARVTDSGWTAETFNPARSLVE
ncbi:hypothetical protein [Devosia submarina]|jgi:hypothetical protein|uniref:hypothetical protein n=1 Tax=Devosia submarina TaxID=1173082 RepID=UPI000D3A5BD0|nr:hypothetical protein [Devosia submarina]